MLFNVILILRIHGRTEKELRDYEKLKSSYDSRSKIQLNHGLLLDGACIAAWNNTLLKWLDVDWNN